MTNIDKIAKYVKAGVDGRLLDRTPLNKMDNEIKKIAKDILDVVVTKIEWDTKIKEYSIDTRIYFKYTDEKNIKRDGYISMDISANNLVRYILV